MKPPSAHMLDIMPYMGTRTLIISDLHLGSQHSWLKSPRPLRHLWQGFDRVIFNGDTAELGYHPQVSQPLLDELTEMLEQDQMDYQLLAGNHDPQISPTRFLTYQHHRVFITHGDAIHTGIAPWSPMPDSCHASMMNIIKIREKAA